MSSLQNSLNRLNENINSRFVSLCKAFETLHNANSEWDNLQYSIHSNQLIFDIEYLLQMYPQNNHFHLLELLQHLKHNIALK
jgi:hypothetical protein